MRSKQLERIGKLTSIIIFHFHPWLEKFLLLHYSSLLPAGNTPKREKHEVFNQWSATEHEKLFFLVHSLLGIDFFFFFISAGPVLSGLLACGYEQILSFILQSGGVNFTDFPGGSDACYCWMAFSSCVSNAKVSRWSHALASDDGSKAKGIKGQK